VVTAVSNPPYWVPRIARVGGLDLLTGAAGRLGRVLGGALVQLQELVAKSTALADVEDAVGDAVDAEVCDGFGASSTAAQLRASDDGDSLDDIWDLSVVGLVCATVRGRSHLGERKP
jgi:hypothetical protein